MQHGRLIEYRAANSEEKQHCEITAGISLVGFCMVSSCRILVAFDIIFCISYSTAYRFI